MGKKLSIRQQAALKVLHASNVGRNRTAASRAKSSASGLGHIVTAETRAKISATKKGRKLTPEHCAKIGAANKRRIITPETRAKISEAQKGNQKCLGHHHTPETRAKMSASAKGRKNTPEHCANISAAKVGEKNARWLGGISRAPYAWAFNNELKAEVRRRDGHKCSLCGAPQAECCRLLDVHHIDYDKKNSDPVNLIALCRSCNARVNTNRAHWTRYFSAKE